jgi:hypothetical protein
MASHGPKDPRTPPDLSRATTPIGGKEPRTPSVLPGKSSPVVHVEHAPAPPRPFVRAPTQPTRSAHPNTRAPRKS